MQTYKIYAAGRFLETGISLKIHRPFDGECFASTYLAGDEELELAIHSGLEAEKPMKELSAFQRHQILNQVGDRMRQSREKLARLLCQESGKPMKYALGEVDRAAMTFQIASEETLRHPNEYLSLDWSLPGVRKEGLVKHFPIGLIAGISPFNFPLNLPAHKIAPALAAGNPILVKPASQTPIALLELAKIIDETDLPKGSLSILPMTRITGMKLVTDPRFKMLSFTGSPDVGWKMKSLAGKKRVVLELGGNAGVLVCRSANLDFATERCITGAFAYSGQVCIHAQRIYVEDAAFQEFSEKFVAKASRLRPGDPLDLQTDISAMIDEENAIRVEAWIEEAVAHGARVLLGGKRTGSFVEPTIITSTTQRMKVCSEEVFGPVVTLESVPDFETGINMINDSEFGLQAGLFTKNIHEMDWAFEHLEVGGVIINDVPTFRVDHMPYGGVKNSGFGREGVKYAMREMMEPRLLVKPF